MELLDPLFRVEEVDELFSPRARLQGMLDFESALGRAEARAGVIPSAASAAIGAKCKAELLDTNSISRGAKLAGNLAIPLIKELTALIAQTDKDAARYVHWGATSQDAIDTGCILQLRQALALIASDLEKLIDNLAQLAAQHRSTLMVARTWMQQALPATFGFEVAGWLDSVSRARARLHDVEQRAIVLQFGGAVGTLAALGAKGQEVARFLAQELHLPLPNLPWHTERDRPAELAAVLGILTGALGKIARDLSLHMQTEIAEVFEPAGEGRGGSSTMPHKRNPVGCAAVLSASLRVPGLVSTMLAAMPQEQQRGLGGWHAEWETLPEIVSLTAGALRRLTETIAGLEVDTNKMRDNLELTRGLIYAEAVSMALAKELGRAQAHRLLEAAVQQAQKEKRHLREVLAKDAQVAKHLTSAQLDDLFDPLKYLGAAETFVDWVVSESRPKRAAQLQRSAQE
jgi:3-carboxy-cis,cis-muconate cycloisomerase